jgi:putative DNA primase/helicase
MMNFSTHYRFQGFQGFLGYNPATTGILDGTPSGTPGVPGVPVLADLLASAVEPGEGEAQQEPIAAVPENERPCFRVYDGWTVTDTGRKLRPGVWLHAMSAPKGKGDPCRWIPGCAGRCTLKRKPSTAPATTSGGCCASRTRRAAGGNGPCRWNCSGRRHRPARRTARDGAGDRPERAFPPGALPARATAKEEGSLRAASRLVRCRVRPAGCGDRAGCKASVIFQSGERGHEEHGQKGTLDGWRAEVAARAVGNPLFALGLSAAFAGPMLACCNAEGGGLHFVGDSSTGKTTILEAAASVWGGANYRRSWRATANGMEGAAALFNDCLLALDEISECDPREVGNIVYSLGNGRGKQRAGRTGAARAVTRWQAFIVSTGERTIATTMAEGGHRFKAGQSVRLLDIPTARQHGCFDVLHDHASGAALSDAIKRAAVTHYGRPGRAFLERLTHDQRDFAARLEILKGLPDFNRQDFEGQDKRAAGRFALLALAGELATEYGLTGWPEGEAVKAAVIGFNAWRSLRGRGNDERRQILQRVSDFIERHGDGRFSDADGTRESQTRDRAGWWRDTQDGRLYLFTAEGMREALKGFDFQAGA